MMKFSLQRLKTSGQEPFVFEEDVDISELEELNNDIRKIPPVHVKGEAIARGNQISTTFTITGSMILPCARTLADVEFPFSIEGLELFSTSPYHQEGADEIHAIDGEVLDLTPYIKENVLLEVPLQVFSENEEAQKNAPKEGQGWELQQDHKKEKKIDPRLAKLQSFFDEKNQ